MNWDGKSNVEIVKETLYKLFDSEIFYASLMDNKEYADFLKSRNHYHGFSSPKTHIDVLTNTKGITITLKEKDEEIYLTWSMAARHIRSWEFEKRQSENSTQNNTWVNTHLCGTVIGSERCEYFLQTGSEETVLNGKKLDICCYYCTSENKVRKIGSGGTWTGLSPKFCPKRKFAEKDAAENQQSYIDKLREKYPKVNPDDDWFGYCPADLFDGDDVAVVDDCVDDCPQLECAECWKLPCPADVNFHNNLETFEDEYFEQYPRDEYTTEADTVPEISEEKNMCDDCINNNENCIKPSEDVCSGYTSKNDTIFNSAAADNKEETTMGGFKIDAFITQQEQLKQISIDLLLPYHNHKFKLYTGERLEDMVNSIKENGVLTPIIVRPAPNDEGKYEILAGHNRCNAAKMAGLTTVPGIVKEKLSDEEAEMYVIETNTMQRGFTDLSVSEQAAVIAMRHSRMFDPAKREEIARELNEFENTDGEETEKKSKLAITGEEYSLSKNTVARLIRVNALLEACDKFTFAVNTKKDLSVRAAVELSYIQKNALEYIFEKYKTHVFEDNVLQNSVAISMSTAEWLREIFTDFRGTKEQAQKLLDKENIEKTRQNIDNITVKPIKISIPSDTFRKYFNEETKPDEAADIIDKALQMYFSQNPKEEKDVNVGIEQLELSERTLKALKTQRINTVAELTELINDRSTAENMLGIKAVEEIIEILELEKD